MEETDDVGRTEIFHTMSSIFGRPQPMPSSAYGGGGFQQQQQQQSERMEATLMELDMVSDIFNRLVKSCHAKCVSKPYTDATLTKGESVCAERCGADADSLR